jgi:hypothetical protein
MCKIITWFNFKQIKSSSSNYKFIILPLKQTGGDPIVKVSARFAESTLPVVLMIEMVELGV